MKNNFFSYFKAFLPAMLWAGLIYFLSSQQVLPALSLSVADFVFKKTAHIFVYSVLCFLLTNGFSKLNFQLHEVWLKTLLICLIYAIFDEIHQSTVLGRTATVIDVGFDMLGASLVIFYKLGFI